jgi:hypothetical protein
VNGGQVGVFKERDEVSLGGFLKGGDGRGLESAVFIRSKSWMEEVELTDRS